jgi:23S rRNA (uracil1939-C5)-methyltransferase
MERNSVGRPETFEVTIEKLVYGGEGLGRHEGQVVFVPFTLPGDHAEVRAIERKKGFIRARVTRILKAGPGRIDPPCPHFGSCGGCQWQHVDYALQVEIKRRLLEEAFHHRLPASRALPITFSACPEAYGYRSRARIQVRGSGADATVGFFRHHSHAVEDVSQCPLFTPPLNGVLTRVRAASREGIFGPRGAEVEIACADDGRWQWEQAGAVGSAPAGCSAGPVTKRIGDFAYATAASVFFQANVCLLGDLIAEVMGLVTGRDTAADLFSGVGLFALPMARRFSEVVAVESDASAHQLCLLNAATARLENLRAACAKVEEWMQAVGSVASSTFDTVLLDPPRSGAGVEVMRHLKEWAPNTIVYISCDPHTLIRDLTALPESDYRIDSIKGFDLFPQTYHFETVVRLRRY